MRAITPQQIVLLLAFIVVIVINLAASWIQRRARDRQRPRPVVPAEALRPPREEWPPAVALPPRARVNELTRGVETPGRPAPSEIPPGPATVPVSRRTPLLGGRTAVRRAIVAMAILGPCPGLQRWPDDGGGSPARE